MRPAVLFPLFLLAALLAGCAATPTQALPREGSQTRRITWVVVADPHLECQRVGRRVLFYKTLGCADWKDPENCIIYTRAPRDAEDRRTMETMGHEMLHCFAGHFHPKIN